MSSRTSRISSIRRPAAAALTVGTSAGSCSHQAATSAPVRKYSRSTIPTRRVLFAKSIASGSMSQDQTGSSIRKREP